MDQEFLILVTAAFILVALAMAAMAIGVIFRRPCLRGSCGGVGNCECARRGVRQPLGKSSRGASASPPKPFG